RSCGYEWSANIGASREESVTILREKRAMVARHDLASTILPFGKYKGKRFDQVPLKYLDWLVGEEFLRPVLRGKIEDYLAVPVISQELQAQLEGEEEAMSDPDLSENYGYGYEADGVEHDE